MTFPYTAVPHYAEEALTAKGERMDRKYYLYLLNHFNVLVLCQE